MKIEDINMKALSEKYLEFLRTRENIGCPMLAQALAELIDGAVYVGLFDDNPHCWVVKDSVIYDLNNLIGDSLFLMISTSEKYKPLARDPMQIAMSLGFSKRSFNKWKNKFKVAMSV